MGDMADEFRYMKELRLKERQSVEPRRFEYAIRKLQEAGNTVDEDFEDDKLLVVNGYIKFWPFTGWYSGKGIGSGRGINNLIRAITSTKEGGSIE